MWQVQLAIDGVEFRWAQNWLPHLEDWTVLMRGFSKLVILYANDIVFKTYVCNRPVVETNDEKEPLVKGNRFRRLQMKWELLSTKDLTVDTPNFDGSQTDLMKARYVCVSSTIENNLIL